MMMKLLLLAACGLLFLATGAESFSCPRCESVVCPELPEDCQPGRGACACCESCRIKRGEECFSMGVGCEDDMVCTKPRPEPQQMENGEWFIEVEDTGYNSYLYHGTCQDAEKRRETPALRRRAFNLRNVLRSKLGQR